MSAKLKQKIKPRDRNKTFNTYEELFKYIQKRRNEKENIPHSEKKRRKSDKIEHTKNKADENSDDEYDSGFEEEPVSPDAIQYIEKKVDENSDDEYESEFEEEPVSPEFKMILVDDIKNYYYWDKNTRKIMEKSKKINDVLQYTDKTVQVNENAPQLLTRTTEIEKLLNEKQAIPHILHLDNESDLKNVSFQNIKDFYDTALENNQNTSQIYVIPGGKRKTKKAKKTRTTRKTKKTKKTRPPKKTKKTRNPKKSRKTRKARLR